LADGSLLTGRHIRVQMHTANAATTNKCQLVSLSAWRTNLLTESFYCTSFPYFSLMPKNLNAYLIMI
jgi:hypothetical protein